MDGGSCRFCVDTCVMDGPIKFAVSLGTEWFLEQRECGVGHATEGGAYKRDAPPPLLTAALPSDK